MEGEVPPDLRTLEEKVLMIDAHENMFALVYSFVKT